MSVLVITLLRDMLFLLLLPLLPLLLLLPPRMLPAVLPPRAEVVSVAEGEVAAAFRHRRLPRYLLPPPGRPLPSARMVPGAH